MQGWTRFPCRPLGAVLLLALTSVPAALGFEDCDWRPNCQSLPDGTGLFPRPCSGFCNYYFKCDSGILKDMVCEPHEGRPTNFDPHNSVCSSTFKDCNWWVDGWDGNSYDGSKRDASALEEFGPVDVRAFQSDMGEHVVLPYHQSLARQLQRKGSAKPEPSTEPPTPEPTSPPPQQPQQMQQMQQMQQQQQQMQQQPYQAKELQPSTDTTAPESTDPEEDPVTAPQVPQKRSTKKRRPRQQGLFNRPVNVIDINTMNVNSRSISIDGLFSYFFGHDTPNSAKPEAP